MKNRILCAIKQKLTVKHLLIAICVAVVISVLFIMLWPLSCGDWIRPVHGDISIYVVTPTFSSSESIPKFESEQWTIQANSDKYFEILEILDSYRCHRKISAISQNNHSVWISIYSENGIQIMEYRGTNDFKVGNTNYSLYGAEGSGENMMNAIYSILVSSSN